MAVPSQIDPGFGTKFLDSSRRDPFDLSDALICAQIQSPPQMLFYNELVVPGRVFPHNVPGLRSLIRLPISDRPEVASMSE